MSKPFYISTEKSKLNIKLIHKFLSEESYWAKDRDIEVIKKSINNSLCFGVYNNENNQVGFARVVTDFTVFAWIMDVFILEEYRKLGLGKLLMNAIMNHKDLQNLKRWGLATNDAHGLYQKYGFTPLENPEIFMTKVKKQ